MNISINKYLPQIFLNFAILFFCIHQSSAQNYQLVDSTYEPQIKTVQLYQHDGTITQTLLNPIIPISQPIPLVLEFDELNTNYNYYYAKIVRCESDWSRSTLADIQFLNAYNIFQLNQYLLSSGTKVPFTHYSFTCPPVKLSGNYVIVIRRDENNGDDDPIILTKRFSVYENNVNVGMALNFSTNNSLRNNYQQVNVTVEYSAIASQVINPYAFKLVIRQNGRWDNAIKNLAPLYVRDFEKALDYSYFNGENEFPGGNEFRAFDIRSIIMQQLNVASIDKKPTPRIVTLMDDTRKDRVYEFYSDINGRVIVNNYETQNGATDGDYINVVFNYKVPDALSGNVHVVGAWNNWKATDTNKLSYDPVTSTYTATLQLKQGYYNYQYVVKDAKRRVSLSPYEGNYSATENEYEALVYFRNIQLQTDLLVGYISKNTQGAQNQAR